MPDDHDDLPDTYNLARSLHRDADNYLCAVNIDVQYDEPTARALDDACAAWLRARGRYVIDKPTADIGATRHDAPAAAVDDDHDATRNFLVELAHLYDAADFQHCRPVVEAARDYLAHVTALRTAATDEMT